MLIRIEKASSVPISRQIVGQFKAQCLAGTLTPGQLVPSVRELARELAVNQNTILRVYEMLTADGYLERRHGSGTFVADHPPIREFNKQRQQFEDELGQVARTGQLLGLDDDQLRMLFERALKQINNPTNTSHSTTSSPPRTQSDGNQS